MSASRPQLRRLALLLVLAGLALAVVARLDAQFRRNFGNTKIAGPEDADGRFHFCRVDFRSGFYGYSDGPWDVDFPDADINFSIRLAELTRTDISRGGNGEPNNLVVELTSPELFNCPFIMMTEVGSAELSAPEVEQLRRYLRKGGFLWADDFWGTAAWEWWSSVMHRVLPDEEHRIVDLHPEHPLFRAQFEVQETPQIANIGHWRSYGHGRERGSDSPHANARAILDRRGRIMVLMTHNTDMGDSFEREAEDPLYFLNNSVPGYAFGINALLYAMTH